MTFAFARRNWLLLQGLNEIFPESVHEYLFRAFDAQITFMTDGNGRATELILHEGGLMCTRIGSSNFPSRFERNAWICR
jgi:hypothetical protein